jgi:hypothetical protein
MIIEPHEIYFGTFFDRFNMRFGPAQPGGRSQWQSGGIVEVAALQKEFEIFRAGRQFIESAALLGLGGFISSPAKDRWLEYLARLPQMQSDEAGVSGDQRIVAALIMNLARDNPLPCFMRAYDGRERQPGLVIVTDNDTPLFYLESVNFLTICLPMRPIGRAKAKPRGPRTARRSRGAGTSSP